MIDRRLAEDETLGDRSTLTPGQVTMLLGICLKTTYFMYHQQFYEQTEGAAMGSPVSPVVANIFMEFVKEVAISTSPSPVRFWKRYVTVYEKTRYMGFFVKIKFDVYLISSTLELTYLQV